MDSTDLTRAQTERLVATLRRHLSFLHRLQQRMDHLGFPPADPLYRATMLARNEAGALYVCALYCACPGRMTPPPTPPPPEPGAAPPGSAQHPPAASSNDGDGPNA